MKKGILKFIAIVFSLNVVVSSALLIIFCGLAVTELVLEGPDVALRVFDGFLRILFFCNIFVVIIALLFLVLSCIGSWTLEKLFDYINNSEFGETK